MKRLAITCIVVAFLLAASSASATLFLHENFGSGSWDDGAAARLRSQDEQDADFQAPGEEHGTGVTDPDDPPVPEPGTWALLSTGILGFGVAFRRRLIG